MRQPLNVASVVNLLSIPSRTKGTLWTVRKIFAKKKVLPKLFNVIENDSDEQTEHVEMFDISLLGLFIFC